MKKGKFLISICFVFIIFFCINLILNYVVAWNASSTVTSIEGRSQIDGGLVTSTKSVMATAINAIRVIGTGIAIIMITYVAIKYMSAAPSEKAEFKKSATAMIVGAIVLFAGTNILSMISKFANSNINIS